MSRRSSALLAPFRLKVGGVEQSRLKYENLFAAGSLDVDDVRQGYSALYLDLFTEFEATVERLFVGLLDGTYRSANRDVVRQARITPKNMTITILFGGRSYLDWLPYAEHTLKRARRFFSDGRPFSYLGDVQKTRLHNLHIIRNAIAHKSTKSQDDFQNLIAAYVLLPHERTPSGYLRSIPNPATGDCQLQLAAADLDGICRVLCQ